MEDTSPASTSQTTAPPVWHLGKVAVHFVIGEIENVVAAMRLNSRWGSGPRLVCFFLIWAVVDEHILNTATLQVSQPESPLLQGFKTLRSTLVTTQGTSSRL